MKLLELGRQVVAVWNTRNPEEVGRFYGDKTVFHDPLVAKETTGQALVSYAAGIFEAFPDLHFKVFSEAVGPNLVMFEWAQCGNNTGSIMGMPATNRYIEIPAVSVLKYRDETLISHYDYWDMKKLMNDLGVL